MLGKLLLQYTGRKIDKKLKCHYKRTEYFCVQEIRAESTGKVFLSVNRQEKSTEIASLGNVS
jgi:hypothetical protein